MTEKALNWAFFCLKLIPKFGGIHFKMGIFHLWWKFKATRLGVVGWEGGQDLGSRKYKDFLAEYTPMGGVKEGEHTRHESVFLVKLIVL